MDRQQPELSVDFAIKSYRYLRLAILALVSAAIAAVLAEERVIGQGCWLRSFSAYYYTPAHSIFVGALVAIGVCLIAIKGTDEREDVCLNVAGILAPIVAFVPTNRPTDACASLMLVPSDFSSPETRPFIANSVLAYAVVGLLVVGVAYVIADRDSVRDAVKALGKAENFRSTGWAGLVVSAALTIGLIGWYVFGREQFLENAHDYTAIAMFVAIGLAAWFRTRPMRQARPWAAESPDEPAQPRPASSYGAWYRVAVWVMVVGVVGPLGVKVVDKYVVSLFDHEFKHEVIWIEAFELVGFALFWIVQTVEHWNLRIICDGTGAVTDAVTPDAAPPI